MKFNTIYEAVTEFMNVKSSQSSTPDFTEEDLVEFIHDKYKLLNFIPEDKELIKDMESIYTLLSSKEILDSLKSYKILEDVFATRFEQFCKATDIKSSLKEFLPDFRFKEVKILINKKGETIRVANYNDAWLEVSPDTLLSDAQFTKLAKLRDYCFFDNIFA